MLQVQPQYKQIQGLEPFYHNYHEFLENLNFKLKEILHKIWGFLPQKNGNEEETLPAKFHVLILEGEGDI